MADDRLTKARKAYEKGDLAAAQQAHTAEAVATEAREEHSHASGRYLSDMVYGASDGIVTTFAVVAGVAGASLSTAVVLILGFANLIADGLSMAIGNYLGTKSQIEYYHRERGREEWETEHMPAGEVEEVRHIFRERGFKGKDLDRAVDIITSDRKVWVDTMMLDELNLFLDEGRSPVIAALATLSAFVVAGLMPLLAYVLSYFIPFFREHDFAIAIASTAVALFAVGSTRTLVTGKRWWLAGFEILIVGGVAAAVAYGVGFALSGLA